MSTPSLKVVVAITSPIAFQSIGTTTVAKESLLVAQSFIDNNKLNAHLSIAVPEENAHHFSQFDAELLICDPNLPSSLATALKNATSFDIVIIHDSQRPLTDIAQFNRVIEALIGDIDGARPATAFTETLKVLNNDQSIDRTIDRNSMLRISTPEVIRFNAIDFAATQSTWFVPLMTWAKTTTVESDPASLRINSVAEIALLESLIKWKQTSSNN